jgi:ABC-type sugar transport system ATPase subunit
MQMAAVLQLDRICRAFSGVPALVDVSLEIETGTVQALIGANGAGKSTLIKILSGALSPDSGRMWLNGVPYAPRDPREAHRAGLATIYQEMNLLPHRSVLDNLIIGQEPQKRGLIDRATAAAAAQRVFDQLGCGPLPLNAPIAELPLGARQQVMIAKSLLNDCRVLIMDEPTAALNNTETAALFRVLATLKAHSVTVIYVSHRLNEVFQIADAVTVLRDGRHISTSPISSLTPNQLVMQMVGRPVQQIFPPRGTPRAEVVLWAERLTSGRAFQEVSFEVRAGEVLAITGLAGSGQSELGQALFGACPIEQGEVRWFHHAADVTPQRAAEAGIGYLPEDRLTEGLLFNLAVQRNLTLAILPRLGNHWGILSRLGERQAAQRQIDRLQIKVPAVMAPVHTLSGGNQQKVALGKWLAREARVLILIEPTQGIDVGVKFDLYNWIAQTAQSGTAVILISSDLAEVAGLAQRVLVMRGGRLAAELRGVEIDPARLLSEVAGAAV